MPGGKFPFSVEIRYHNPIISLGSLAVKLEQGFLKDLFIGLVLNMVSSLLQRDKHAEVENLIEDAGAAA